MHIALQGKLRERKQTRRKYYSVLSFVEFGVPKSLPNLVCEEKVLKRHKLEASSHEITTRCQHLTSTFTWRWKSSIITAARSCCTELSCPICYLTFPALFIIWNVYFWGGGHKKETWCIFIFFIIWVEQQSFVVFDFGFPPQCVSTLLDCPCLFGASRVGRNWVILFLQKLYSYQIEISKHNIFCPAAPGHAPDLKRSDKMKSL